MRKDTKVDISEVIQSVRGINALRRNKIHNLHDLLSLTYSQLLNFRNTGVMTVYSVIKDVMRYLQIKELSKDPVIIQEVPEESEKTVSAENSRKDLTVDLLVAFNQLNREGQQTLVDTAKAFMSLDKFTKETEKTEDPGEYN